MESETYDFRNNVGTLSSFPKPRYFINSNPRKQNPRKQKGPILDKTQFNSFSLF